MKTFGFRIKIIRALQNVARLLAMHDCGEFGERVSKTKRSRLFGLPALPEISVQLHIVHAFSGIGVFFEMKQCFEHTLFYMFVVVNELVFEQPGCLEYSVLSVCAPLSVATSTRM